MSKTTKYITTAKSAGKKPVAPAESKNTYSIYIRCDECPMSVYIDLVCDDNLRALIREGEPPAEVLEETRINLITEFAELSGNPLSQSVHNGIRRIHQLKSEILALSLCIQLIEMGQPSQECLEHFRISFKDNDGTAILRRINSIIKLKSIKLKEELSKLEKSSKKGSQTVTRDSFSEQFTILSTFHKFHIPRSLSAADFAGYLKQYQKSLSNGAIHK